MVQMTLVRHARVARPGGRVCRTRGLLVGVVVMALLAGCTSAGTGAAEHRASSSGPSVDVSNSRGGTVTAGGASLVVPAGAVTGQVTAHIRKSSSSVLQAVTPKVRSMLRPVGEAVDVDLSGKQPLRPLTLTLPVTEVGDHPTLAIITNHRGTMSVLTGTLSANRHSYTVKVSNLSVFQLVVLDARAVYKTFTDGIKVALGTLGVHGDKPSCFGKSATFPSGGRVQVMGVRGPLWPCVSTVGNTVRVTVHSVDALPWQVRTRAGEYAGAAEVDSKAVAVQAIYTALASDRPHAEGLVLPQGQGQWTVPGAELPVDMAGKVSTGAWLASAAVFSGLYLADAASFGQAGNAKALAKGFQRAISDKASGWDCMVSASKTVPDGAPPSPGQLAALLQAAVACAGPLAKPVLGSALGGLATLVLAIVSGGAAVVVGGFEGALRTVTGTNTTTWKVSPQQPATASVTAADLLSAPVPALRGNPAGRLVNGKLPNPFQGGLVELSQSGGTAPARGDFTGDGVSDAAAVIGATSGAGGWDVVVELYTNRDHLLGGFDPAGASNFEHATIRTMVVRNGEVVLHWDAFNMSDGRAGSWSAHLRWDGHKVVVTNLASVQ
jgi:hypothetical protein